MLLTLMQMLMYLRCPYGSGDAAQELKLFSFELWHQGDKAKGVMGAEDEGWKLHTQHDSEIQVTLVKQILSVLPG